MKCQETAGVLIPRPCRNEAATACQICGKQVCGEHIVALPTGQEACTHCAADQNVGQGVQREQYYDDYGYDTGFYRWHSGPSYTYYTYHDYDTFDRTSTSTDVEPGETLENLEGS